MTRFIKTPGKSPLRESAAILYHYYYGEEDPSTSRGTRFRVVHGVDPRTPGPRVIGSFSEGAPPGWDSWVAHRKKEGVPEDTAFAVAWKRHKKGMSPRPSSKGAKKST